MDIFNINLPTLYLLIFTLDNQRFALPVSSMERVFPVVEVTPLPDAPDIVTGIVNIHGSIIPVFNIRRRFHLPETAVNLTDKLIIARTAGRSVGIVVDAVSDVMEYPEKDIVNADKIVPGMEYIYGVAKLDDNMILIYNIDKFLSPGEENKLDEAVKKL